MEQLAQVRIAAWQEGGLWLLNTEPLGPRAAPRAGFHAHHAIQIVIGLGGWFRLWTAEEDLSAPYAAVAPDVEHRFDAQGAYAILFVEPESWAGRVIGAWAFDGGDLRALPPSRFVSLRGRLEALRCATPPSAEQLARIGRDLVAGLAGSAPPAPIDARVRNILHRIAARPDEPLTLEMAANMAGLSKSRFSHLFVEQTGLSFKSYRLWIRLTRAVRLMTDGLSLTAVAHEAGFADSAHFSRTFRRMFGVAPASLSLF